MSVITTPAGRRIFYDVAGEGPPLLAITGTGGSRAGHLSMLRDPFARHFRIIAMDNRDAGESDPEPDYYTMADMASDAAALLNALTISRAHVLGGSLGGMIALQFAIDYPDKVHRLVLIGTFAHGPEGHRSGEPLPPPPPWWTDDPVERWRRIVPQIIGPKYRSQLTDEMLTELAEPERGNKANWKSVMHQQAAEAGNDFRGRLADVQAPTLVVHGELDTVVPPEHGRKLAAGIPGARLHLLPEVGHLTMTEAPEQAGRAILDFLGETDARFQ